MNRPRPSTENSASRAAERQSDKREAILDAALQLFVERGFHGTAVPDVADPAGVGAGTICRYFESKEHLVNDLYRRHKQKLVTRVLKDFPLQSSTREQFGKPIATFQAVAQRAADAYIDVEAMRWTAWQAISRLADGQPATEELAIAKFWAADGGHRVTYAAQHLHGGIGLDLDYPVHRYYLWAKEIELTLGSASRQLVRLGATFG